MSEQIVISMIGAISTVIVSIVGIIPVWLEKSKKAKATKQKQSHTLEISIVFSAFIIGVSLIIASFMFYKTPVEPVTKIIDYNKLLNPGNLSLAKEKGRPYIIEDVVVLVKLEQQNHARIKSMHATYRTMYSLLALEDINKNSTVFRERYGSDYANKIVHWYGTDIEALHGIGKVYDVLFEIPNNNRKTIVTGADFYYTLPLPSNRKTFSNIFTLNPNEDLIMYPNDNDIISNIMIVVESENMKITPLGRAAKRLKSDRSLVENEAFLNVNQINNQGTRSITARWANVLPGEDVGLAISW